MVLTELADIVRVLTAVFVGVATVLALVVYLEQWLEEQTRSRPEPIAITAIPELDELEDRGAA